MGIKICFNLKKDKHGTYNKQLFSAEPYEETSVNEFKLLGYIQGMAHGSVSILMWGEVLNPIWKGLETLRINAELNVTFHNSEVQIIICEVSGNG